MVDIAKDNWSDALNLLWKSIPSVCFHPVDVRPVDACDSIIVKSFFDSFDDYISGKTENESDKDDGYVDDDWKHTDYCNFLKDADLLLEDENQVQEDGSDRNTYSYPLSCI